MKVKTELAFQVRELAQSSNARTALESRFRELAQTSNTRTPAITSRCTICKKSDCHKAISNVCKHLWA